MKTLISFCGLLLLTTAVTGLAAEPSKWGYINTTGEMVIPPRFESAGPFSVGLAAVRTEQNGPWGYIDTAGKMVIPQQFADTYPFSEGLAQVRAETNGKWGYVDKTGTFVIPPQFIGASSFFEGLAAVQKAGSKWGYIDKTGTVVIPLKFVYAEPFSDGLALVGMSAVLGGDGYRYIDKAGKLVIPTLPSEVTFARSFVNGLATIYTTGGPGYIDKTGQMVIPPQIHNGELPFSDGMAPMPSNGKWGYVDKTGTFVIPPQFASADSFSERLARVRTTNNGKWGFVYITGQLIIPPQFAGAERFSEGLARVQIVKGGKWGYIDTIGMVVIPPQFKNASRFSEGLAAVQPKGQEAAPKAGGVVGSPRPNQEPVASGASQARPPENTEDRLRLSEGLGGTLLQVFVLIMGILTGVRGSLMITGSWTLIGWPARVVGWSFVLASLCSLSFPGFLTAPGTEPPTTVQALAPLLGPYLLAIAVTVAVLIWERKHRGSAA